MISTLFFYLLKKKINKKKYKVLGQGIKKIQGQSLLKVFYNQLLQIVLSAGLPYYCKMSMTVQLYSRQRTQCPNIKIKQE